MNIEVVDIRKIIGDGNLKAFADIKFDDAIMVKGFSILQGKKGIFVSMPKKAGKDGRWIEILLPLNEKVKQEIEDKLLVAYDKEAEV